MPTMMMKRWTRDIKPTECTQFPMSMAEGGRKHLQCVACNIENVEPKGSIKINWSYWDSYGDFSHSSILGLGFGMRSKTKTLDEILSQKIVNKATRAKQDKKKREQQASATTYRKNLRTELVCQFYTTAACETDRVMLGVATRKPTRIIPNAY
jgi:hypothetical protein